MKTNSPLIRRLFSATLLLAAIHIVPELSAARPPESGELFSFEGEPDLSGFKVEKATVHWSAEERVIKMEYEGGEGYPGVDFPIPEGHWDLAGYEGIEVEVVNDSLVKIGVGMRIDNPGDWKTSPWNTEVKWLNPGESGLIQVRFGQSYGKPAFDLDPSNVVTVKVLISKPRDEGTLLIKSLKAFGKTDS